MVRYGNIDEILNCIEYDIKVCGESDESPACFALKILKECILNSEDKEVRKVKKGEWILCEKDVSDMIFFSMYGEPIKLSTKVYYRCPFCGYETNNPIFFCGNCGSELIFKGGF